MSVTVKRQELLDALEQLVKYEKEQRQWHGRHFPKLHANILRQSTVEQDVLGPDMVRIMWDLIDDTITLKDVT